MLVPVGGHSEGEGSIASALFGLGKVCELKKKRYVRYQLLILKHLAHSLISVCSPIYPLIFKEPINNRFPKCHSSDVITLRYHCTATTQVKLEIEKQAKTKQLSS